jgi:polyhydroxybutyrate depolymerase
MKRLSIIATALIVLVVAGYGVFSLQGDDLAITEGSFLAGGDRSTSVDLPTGYNANNPAPLLLDLHGFMGDGLSQQRFSRLSNVARENGFVYAAPDGLRNSNGDQFWNASRACCNFDRTDIDDAAFLKSLIDEISEKVAIDPKRIYIFGHSNGAFMSYKFACTYPNTVAAIVGVAGAMDVAGNDCAISSPVSVLEIHGTADSVIRFTGGAIVGNSYTSVEQTLDIWHKLDKCSGAPMAKKNIDIDESIDGAETKVFESTCTNSTVTSWQIVDGLHGPAFSATFPKAIIEWLLANPKQ